MQPATTPSNPPSLPELDESLRDLQRKIEQRQFDDALQAADRLLAHFPGHRDLLYMRAVALRHLDRVPDALATLDALEDMHPTYPRLFQERGHCYMFLRQAPQAIQAFSRAVELNPALPASWRMLASLYAMTGRRAEAENAGEHVAKLATLAVEVVTARSMLADGNLLEAEAVIRPYVKRAPDDVEGLRVFALVAQRGRSRRTPRSCWKTSWSKHRATMPLARTSWLRCSYPPTCQGAGTDRYLDAGTADTTPMHRRTLAEHPGQSGCDDRGHHAVPRTAERKPGDADLHMYHGHALRRHRACAPRRNIITRRPCGPRRHFGDAYWSLANLKTYRFSE